MISIPKFRLYGEGDPSIEEAIQPKLDLREWTDLSTPEKKIILKNMEIMGFLSSDSHKITQSIFNLNQSFMMVSPGKMLLNAMASNTGSIDGAAYDDFRHILLQEESTIIVSRLISEFAKQHIKEQYLQYAEKENEEEKIKQNIQNGFNEFDALSKFLNKIFEQFAINLMLTRNALVPRQDDKIEEYVYAPAMRILSDPKWKTVSDSLTEMFEDYNSGNYPEVITKAHSAVQRFLQILAGENGKNGKGEMAKLFKEIKNKEIIPTSLFTEPIIDVFQKFIVSERANNSTAKPTLKKANSSDALLVMNVTMVFLQHCLQEVN